MLAKIWGNENLCTMMGNTYKHHREQLGVVRKAGNMRPTTGTQCTQTLTHSLHKDAHHSIVFNTQEVELLFITSRYYTMTHHRPTKLILHVPNFQK